MLEAGRQGEPETKVEPQPAIRTGVTASAIAHLSILALVILLSDVNPFHAVTAETIAVDIVTPQQVTPDKPEPPAQVTPPKPDPWLVQKAPETPPAAAPAPQQQQAPQQQAALSTPRQSRPEAAAPPKPEQGSSAPATTPPPATSGSSAPGYSPPQPDLTVKYNVMLGLPPDLPVAPSGAGQKDGDGYDASAASMAADVSSSVIAEFRRHLKTCSKLPASVAPSDHVLVKLRVFMTPQGRLAADPAVGGGSANIKAIELLKSAIDALKSCQPYAMLPPDRYGEWKALDLTFTPKDFGG
jgi:outer membrane biosynthesis protein TonB